jgi:hypothetical protein
MNCIYYFNYLNKPFLKIGGCAEDYIEKCAKNLDNRISSLTGVHFPLWKIMGATALIYNPLGICTGVLAGINTGLTTPLLAAKYLNHTTKPSRDKQDYDRIKSDLKESAQFAKENLFLVCITGPIIEELYYRGCIQNLLLAALGSQTAALLLSALMFGAVHTHPNNPPAINILSLCSSGLFGLIAGVLNQECGLLASIGAHITHNTIVTSFSEIEDKISSFRRVFRQKLGNYCKNGSIALLTAAQSNA